MPRFRIASLLDRPLVLVFAGLAAGLLLDLDIPGIPIIAVVLLAALMTLALAPHELRGLRALLRPAALATLLGLVPLSAAFLLVGRLFPAATWGGWVFLAAAPPAVSVIPYATVLRSDVRLAVGGTLLSYAAAFLLLPGIAFAFLGAAVDLLPLVEATAFLVGLPLVLSRFVHGAHLSELTFDRGRNVIFLLVYALVTAAIRDVIFQDPVGTAVVLAGTGLAVAGSWTVWTLASRSLLLSPGTRTTHDLFASYKNQTLAAALALGLLGPLPALPAILAGVFEAFWIPVLAAVARRRGLSPSPR